jgi:hypothetical protein
LGEGGVDGGNVGEGAVDGELAEEGLMQAHHLLHVCPAPGLPAAQLVAHLPKLHLDHVLHSTAHTAHTARYDSKV